MLVTAFLLIAGRWIASFYLVAAVTGGLLISNGLKIGVARPRPTVVLTSPL
jgi:hypothetical protein